MLFKVWYQKDLNDEFEDYTQKMFNADSWSDGVLLALEHAEKIKMDIDTISRED